MESIIYLFIVIPFAGFLLSLLVHGSREKALTAVAFSAFGSNLLLSLAYLFYWLWDGAQAIDVPAIRVFHASGYVFSLKLIFNHLSATFLLMGNMISFMVVVYSRYYMHRESGFKRFFNTILFFYAGYSLAVLAGNFETLFAAWEVLGISSFLLIAFYRLRYLPVKNALKVFTIYRIGDVGILLAMWMGHHLWHEGISFYQLLSDGPVHRSLLTQSGTGVFISLMILIAAAAKSAQLPFTAWLPRAMEGPTPSSAIFYGSLSVHIGAFLLLRTYALWEHQEVVRWAIALLGLLTAVVGTLIARVQTTVKGQIAYSSAAQIGVIFMEIAAGFHVLALIHIVSNAFLRTYQLLISPSVVTYLVRRQFYHFSPRAASGTHGGWFSRLANTVYLLSLKEWNLEKVVFRLIFNPLKKLREVLQFLHFKALFILLLPLYLAGLYFASLNIAGLESIRAFLAPLAALLALMMVARAYNERGSSRLAWLLVVFAHFYVDLAVTLNHHLDFREAGIYLGGVVVSGFLGYYCLYKVRAFEHHRVGLNSFHGLVDRYPVYAFLFLGACLGVAGFPITSTFFGEDLILAHIGKDQVVLATLVSLTFIINGIAVIRIYTRVFLGKVHRNPQDIADLTN